MRKKKKQALQRLAQYRIDQGLTWRALTDHFNLLIGSNHVTNTLYMAVRTGSCTDRLYAKIERFLSGVNPNAS